MDIHAIVWWAVVACFIYLASVYAVFVLVLVASAIEHRFRTSQARIEDYEALADSHQTIPVSLIAPAYNEALVVVSAVESMLALTYPEFEVIVVNDGSTDTTLRVLERAFDLERREIFWRRQLDSRPIRGVYRSRRDPRLIVVDKENGGKADALNAGFNLARYRYVCTVDSDTIYYRHALLGAMRVAMRDPATVVGVTSKVAISSRPESDGPSSPGALRIDDKAITNFQLLDYLRAFVNNRLGWTRLNFMLCSVGAFAIWRRDVVAELGGFSGSFTCEDIEFTYRVHERFRREARPCRVIALPDSVGRTEGPDRFSRLVSQRARWQRVITETVWHYRRMFLNPRYGSVGLLGVPFYVLVEVLAPIFQVVAVVLAPLAWALGMLSGVDFACVLLAIAFTNGIFTNIAVWLYDRGSRTYALGDLVHLMLLGPIDLFYYRPFIFFAQAKGFVDFLRGDKAWHKFERNQRVDSRVGPPEQRPATL